MKITELETIQLGAYPNIVFVRLHTDDGSAGLGETFFGAHAVAAYLHERVAPALLGRDPLHIDRHAADLRGYVGYAGSGAETRGNSAIDLALWDLFGKATGQPVYQLLGGPCRDRIRVYNTCAGYEYTRRSPDWSIDDWGLPGAAETGPYEDLQAFLERPAELAQDLLSEGIRAMKIWPFDTFAEASGGQYLSAVDLRAGLEPFARIRDAVGTDIDVMLELHGLWSVPMAKRIVAAVDEYEPFWIEDPVRPDDLDGLAEVAAVTSAPITAGETLAGRWAFRDLLERRAAGIVMLDLGWVGGLSEARKIAAMAEAYQRPVAPHDCTGPVVLTAAVHLSVNLPNAIVQEFVRAHYSGWYRDLVTVLPPIADGNARPPDGPGLGTELRPDLLDRPDVTRRVSVLNR